METFPRNAHTDARLYTAIRRFAGSLFLTPAHYQRMECMKVRQGCRRRRDTPAYYAAMYLLTSNSVALNELTISEVVDTLAFSLIVNTLLIARYGYAVLKISEKEGQYIRRFLSEDGYAKVLDAQRQGRVRVYKHASIIEGHIISAITPRPSTHTPPMAKRPCPSTTGARTCSASGPPSCTRTTTRAALPSC